MDIAPARTSHALGDPTADAPGLDDELAGRAREDRTAFAELYVRQRGAVHAYLRARTASEDEALELTAATFERALAAIDRYSSRGGGVRAWLLRIARNAAIDEGRRRRRSSTRLLRWSNRGDRAGAGGADRLATEAIDSGPTPEDAALASDERRRLHRALAALPDAHRDALGLRFGAGLNARDIGAVLGKREAATQKLIERAIARLREIYRDDD
jgi:RNA polymerase sigma-70 factor (ECF subfamily)